MPQSGALRILDGGSRLVPAAVRPGPRTRGGTGVLASSAAQSLSGTGSITSLQTRSPHGLPTIPRRPATTSSTKSGRSTPTDCSDHHKESHSVQTKKREPSSLNRYGRIQSWPHVGHGVRGVMTANLSCDHPVGRPSTTVMRRPLPPPSARASPDAAVTRSDRWLRRSRARSCREQCAVAIDRGCAWTELYGSGKAISVG